MRGVPQQHRRGIVEPLAVVMADHRGAAAALGPVAAGAIVRAGEGGAVGLRTGQDVVAPLPGPALVTKNVIAFCNCVPLISPIVAAATPVRRTIRVALVMSYSSCCQCCY